jgi:hypothetical protein
MKNFWEFTLSMLLLFVLIGVIALPVSFVLSVDNAESKDSKSFSVLGVNEKIDENLFESAILFSNYPGMISTPPIVSGNYINFLFQFESRPDANAELNILRIKNTFRSSIKIYYSTTAGSIYAGDNQVNDLILERNEETTIKLKFSESDLVSGEFTLRAVKI